MTSIHDVAKRAGVSTATVSHILNQTRFVSDETRKKVMDVIEELDYYPSKLARGLARNKSQTIGIVFSDIANQHFTQIYKGIEEYFYAFGFDLILADTSENPQRQEEVLASLLSRSVDGLIIAPAGFPSKRLKFIKEKGLPVVLLDRQDPETDFPMVGVDNSTAAYQGAIHLFEDGHSRIGLILGLKNISAFEERLAGFIQAAKENGIEQDPELIFWGDSGLESGYNGAMALLNNADRPSAIFCTNNLMALGALHAFREKGLKCPEDISMVGFDDHLWADIFTPPLTVISQPTHELGKTAARLLHQYISEGAPVNSPQKINLETQLIIRGSCSLDCHEKFMSHGHSSKNFKAIEEISSKEEILNKDGAFPDTRWTG